MNTQKKHTPQPPAFQKRKKTIKGLQRILGLNAEMPSKKNMGIITLLVITFIIYISNSYIAEHKAIEINKLTKENKELRAEYILLSNKVTFCGSQSELAKRLLTKNLKEAVTPPNRITKPAAKQK